MTAVGRPLSFDREQALLSAMAVFWDRGYEGTSMADLTEAMGINRPSLYGAFGNKEELFAEALACYEAKEGAEITRLLNEMPTAREAIEATLRYNAHVYVEEGRPRGCMIVLSSLLGRPESTAIRALLAERRRVGENELRDRIERGQAQGDVHTDVDARNLAAFYTTVLQGMSITARDGATQSDLDRIVELAMSGWPSPGHGKSMRFRKKGYRRATE
ncbi:TetR/AcrR family transcriptional regulator [Methylibium petroleiphilum]|uniref:TetR/AcrR family transcriptional regulator n=1 Tax=Methylibium petroleiphilum TaxID=105560 RepID=UPI001AD0BEF7|nr:TetR/AcrR family transcriptional regulator [Methylibium petroleiphilum]MBN9205969.1 TetR/AcrR family transcriptional regulator [Methylibium petroleiphilum]